MAYDFKNTAKELLRFIDRSPSAFHAVKSISEMLDDAGYQRLSEGKPWKPELGRGYYVTRNLSSIIAFRIPKQRASGFQIAASHSDFPSFKIKEIGEIVSGETTRLNTEKYGGMICSTWLDRPLSVAGRVIVRRENKLEARLVDIDRDFLLIPNVAIHMNRTLNDGYKFNPACDTVPLYGEASAKGKFSAAVAEAAGVSEK